MTFAQQMLDQWLNNHDVLDPETLAKAIDPRCRIEGYLYSKRQRFIFSDYSQAILANGCLNIKPKGN